MAAPTETDDREKKRMANARAEIKAGRLPIIGGFGGVLMPPSGGKKDPILCAACTYPVGPREETWKLTLFNGAPEMHYPVCFNEWMSAAREELIETKLKFDERFVPDDQFNCIIWADQPEYQRTSFVIGSEVLINVLGVGNPVHHEKAIKVCEGQRDRIELACRLAFYERPNERVELLARDFR